MDGLLRSKELSEIKKDIESLFEKAYCRQNGIVLFPVRHHSPACSWHLTKLINDFEPDVILVEGPENADDIIPFIASENTKAPFCLYFSFDDVKGKINDAKEQYKAYYPFLDFSPELTALREAAKKGIECHFIDLSYGDKLLNVPEYSSEELQGLNDSEFLRGDYHKFLCEQLGCKSFSECWEMLFEIQGCHSNTEDFIRNVFYYCFFTRINTPQKELELQGDLVREMVMLEHIQKARNNFNKVLVVTGGMHTVALAEQLENKIPKENIIKRLKKEESPCYLMPYSFEESDRNYGYQSGMVYPYFYQKVWENMGKKKMPFENAVLSFMIQTARTIRKKQSISIADEIQSFYMAKGLAQLRGKRECGVFEALDAVKASFVKGEVNSLYQPALKALTELMTGMQMGIIDSNAGVPPIVNDFIQCCKTYKIQTTSSMKKETKLDKNNNKAHREKSFFLSQMEFLKTGFCHCIRGRKSQNDNKRILLRETWEYRYSPNVQAELISVSAYGGTVRQSALTLLEKEARNNHSNTKSVADLLEQAGYMGLIEAYDLLMNQLDNVVSEDMDFFSVSDGFSKLWDIKREREIIDEVPIPALDKLLSLCLDRLLTLVYTVIQSNKEHEDAASEGMKRIYSYLLKENQENYEETFLECCNSIFNDSASNGAMTGICAAILYKKNKIEFADLIIKLKSYLNGTPEAKKVSASFLKGLFKIARDVIFLDTSLMQALDEILRNTDGDLFLEILPDLRLAFTDFMLYETDKIASMVSEMYHNEDFILDNQIPIDQKELERSAEADDFCRQALSEWFLWGGCD